MLLFWAVLANRLIRHIDLLIIHVLLRPAEKVSQVARSVYDDLDLEQALAPESVDQEIQSHLVPQVSHIGGFLVEPLGVLTKRFLLA